MSKKEKRMIEIAGKIIDLMRSEGIAVDSPYDLENFVEDYCSHSQLKETGRFQSEDDEDE